MSTLVIVIGWMLIPVFTFLVNKFLSYLNFNLSRKLQELELDIIPSLKLVLGAETEERILRGAKDEAMGNGSDLKTLGERERKNKSALCDAEDALGLVQYRRIEKKVISGDGKSLGTRICNWVLQAIGGCITYCKRSSFGQKLRQRVQNLYYNLGGLGDKLQQWVQSLDPMFWDFLGNLQQYAKNLNQMFRDFPLRVRGTLVQYAHGLHQYIHQGAAGQPTTPNTAPAPRSTAELRHDIEEGSATPSPTPDVAPSNLPSPNALPNSAGSTTELCGGNQHGSAEEPPTLDAPLDSLVQMIYDWLVYWFSALYSSYLAVCFLRDSSYELVGIKVQSRRHDHFPAARALVYVNNE